MYLDGITKRLREILHDLEERNSLTHGGIPAEWLNALAAQVEINGAVDRLAASVRAEAQDGQAGPGDRP